jgi:hypothetical protein
MAHSSPPSCKVDPCPFPRKCRPGQMAPACGRKLATNSSRTWAFLELLSALVECGYVYERIVVVTSNEVGLVVRLPPGRRSRDIRPIGCETNSSLRGMVRTQSATPKRTLPFPLCLLQDCTSCGDPNGNAAQDQNWHRWYSSLLLETTRKPINKAGNGFSAGQSCSTRTFLQDSRNGASPSHPPTPQVSQAHPSPWRGLICRLARMVASYMFFKLFGQYPHHVVRITNLDSRAEKRGAFRASSCHSRAANVLGDNQS